MKIHGSSENYQIVKKKSKDITTLHLRVEPTKKRYNQANLHELKKEIEEELFLILNLHIPVEIVKPDTLPRSEGKAKRIVDE